MSTSLLNAPIKLYLCTHFQTLSIGLLKQSTLISHLNSFMQGFFFFLEIHLILFETLPNILKIHSFASPPNHFSIHHVPSTEITAIFYQLFKNSNGISRKFPLELNCNVETKWLLIFVKPWSTQPRACSVQK